MRISALAAALCLGSAVIAAPAQAGSRYATPPPITLSPDLTGPWTLQLKPRALPARVQRRIKRRAVNLRSRSGSLSRARPVRRASLQSAAPRETFDRSLLPTRVAYDTRHKPGTIVVDTIQRRLFLVERDGMAMRYGIGVGKPGFEWSGSHKVTRKAEWPDWRPPKEMIARERKKGRELPAFVPGGPENPLGARSLYLGSTLYRIHGTNQNWSIGQAVSSGCIRMRNEDVMDLYDRVRVGVRVHVI